MFEDHAFDVVILSQTLQAMHNTERILKEIARVGKEGIVSFPNFGHWYHVWSIALGRMPVSKQMPYQWYNTPNIHLCTPKISRRWLLKSDIKYWVNNFFAW